MMMLNVTDDKGDLNNTILQGILDNFVPYLSLAGTLIMVTGVAAYLFF
jgi:hypothetical protein